MLVVLAWLPRRSAPHGTGPAAGAPAAGATVDRRTQATQERGPARTPAENWPRCPDVTEILSGMTTAAAADPDKRAPGRPRSARSEQAIIDAVLEMIADGDAIETLSIESIAARAGVGKATIYRRWSSREQVVIDAVASLKLPVPEVAGESVRDDLITLLSRDRPARHAARSGQVMNCLLPQIARNAELHHWYQQVIEPRRDVTRQVLRRGDRDR